MLVLSNRDLLPLAPIPQLHAARADEAIDVRDRADSRDRQTFAIGRERQSANATDGSRSLDRIERVEIRGAESGNLFEENQVPNAHEPRTIAARGVAGIVADC